jgi:ABC-type transport system involved in multi-copper enzyme maturation permease subunit
MSFYVEGWWGGSGSAAGRQTLGNLALREIVMNTLSTMSLFVSIIAVLQVVHEYRHNTITYTLTASNSRTKVLLSKAFVLVCFAVVYSLVAALLSIGLYLLALSMKGATLPPQTIDWFAAIGRGVFYNIAYVSIGMIIAFISRNIAGAIAILLIVPTTVEPLLGIVLKNNAIYLPFAALEKVIMIEGSPAFVQGELSVAKALAISCAYLVVGWLVTWQLFLRRDAN